MTPQTLAALYAALAALPLSMHLALAAGAPLGRFTIGGRFAGRLPPLWRGLAIVQAGLLAAMASAVLDHGGVINLGLAPTAFRLALALTVLTFLANAASPSRPERRLWTPITLGMTAAAVGVALDGDNIRIVVWQEQPGRAGLVQKAGVQSEVSHYFLPWEISARRPASGPCMVTSEIEKPA
jgi:hypothetical protein